MLIDFHSIVQKHGVPHGIIHIGAHLMEERNDYLEHGIKNIIWIEANPNIYSIISQYNLEANEKLFNYTVSDENDKIIDFYITNNTQSSSILKLDKHQIYYPSISINNTISTITKRMDTIIEKEDINISLYDFVNIDIQGAELLAIKGFGTLLSSIKYLYIEINTNTLYENCPMVQDIDHYLKRFSFDRINTKMTNCEWGDALYINRNKL